MSLPFQYGELDKTFGLRKRSTHQPLRLLIILLAFGLFIPILQAQKITISQEIGLRNDYAYSILGWVDDNLLMFRDKGHSFFLQAFDRDLNLKWERELLLGEGRADIIGVVALDDRVHLVYGLRERGDYYIRHFAYSNNASLVDTATIAVYDNPFVSPRIFSKESENKQMILLFEYQNAGLKLYSYDLKAMGLMWTHTINLNGQNLDENFTSLMINNVGDFFLPLKSNKQQQKTQYLHLFTNTADTKSVIHDTIRLGDVQLFDIYPVYDHVQKTLVITGLYGERNSSRANGFYYITYHNTRKNLLSYLPFDESLLVEVSGRNVSASKGLSDFTVRDVALRQDGGVVIIAELIKEFSRRSSLPMQRDNGTYIRDGWVDYYFEDMILFAVYPDGREHWKEVLRKRQYSQDDGAMYSSYMLFKTPERLRFLFNDEIKQENTVGGYEVTGKGYVERKTVFNTDYHKLKLRFMDGIQVAYNECIVPSERNNRLSLIRILYDD